MDHGQGGPGHEGEATLAYRNSKQNFDRLTNRAVRSLVKLFSIDEDCIQEYLKELQRRIDRLSADGVADPAQGLFSFYLQYIFYEIHLTPYILDKKYFW